MSSLLPILQPFTLDIPAASVLPNIYLPPQLRKSAVSAYLHPLSTFLSSTLIWEKPPGKTLGLLSQDSFHMFPVSLFFSVLCCLLFRVWTCLLYMYFLDFSNLMILVILSWLKVGVNNALPCIFKPYIKLPVWVCLHSSVIIQNCLRILIVFFSFVSLIGQLLFMWHIR